uniref:RNase H type-1 domain-containing protein n=1 Tax=Cucumis melo TaxID=3656 RepID=A0A9I9CXF6_CUCME
MEGDKDAYYVVQKGDVFGFYRSAKELVTQHGRFDPNATIYKGYHLSKEAEEYLVSHGLQSATYSISAANVTKDLFGKILPCFPYEQPSTTRGKMAEEYPKAERQERVLKNTEYTYFLEFDGASKGNPGLAGAGAILRANDGSTVQGLWKLKNQNMAELCKVAKELKDKFVSFEISHVPRNRNSDADALANRAIHLQDGVVVEDCIHK